MPDKDKPKTNGHELMVLLIVFIPIALYMAIIVPDLPFLNPRIPCYKVMEDAFKIAEAISDYFTDPKHLDVKRSDIEGMVDIENPWTFTRNGDEIIIQVTDHSGKCPDEYQNRNPEWDSGVYTFRM